MTKPKVLLLGKIGYAEKAWDSLAGIADVVKPRATTRQEFIEECKTSPLNEVVACYRTASSAKVTGLWNEELVAGLPDSLKSVSHNGAGYDQITVPALTSRSILLTNVPTAVDDATADAGLFLLLGALRNFGPSIRTLHDGQWRGNPSVGLGHDPQGKLLGIIGMGGIGRNMAKKCRAFGMRIQYYNRKRLEDQSLEEGAKYVDMGELLRTSDVISMNLPLNPQTKHTLGREEFKKCKRGVVIVNTARGGVIDEAALVEALESGQVGAVGLDVFEDEPDVHPGLLKNERAFMLPHMGTHTYETALKMEEWCIGNVHASLEWHVEGKKSSGKEMSVVGEQAELFTKLIAEA